MKRICLPFLHLFEAHASTPSCFPCWIVEFTDKFWQASPNLKETPQKISTPWVLNSPEIQVFPFKAKGDGGSITLPQTFVTGTKSSKAILWLHVSLGEGSLRPFLGLLSPHQGLGALRFGQAEESLTAVTSLRPNDSGQKLRPESHVRRGGPYGHSLRHVQPCPCSLPGAEDKTHAVVSLSEAGLRISLLETNMLIRSSNHRIMANRTGTCPAIHAHTHRRKHACTHSPTPTHPHAHTQTQTHLCARGLSSGKPSFQSLLSKYMATWELQFFQANLHSAIGC